MVSFSGILGTGLAKDHMMMKGRLLDGETL